MNTQEEILAQLSFPLSSVERTFPFQEKLPSGYQATAQDNVQTVGGSKLPVSSAVVFFNRNADLAEKDRYQLDSMERPDRGGMVVSSSNANGFTYKLVSSNTVPVQNTNVLTFDGFIGRAVFKEPGPYVWVVCFLYETEYNKYYGKTDFADGHKISLRRYKTSAVMTLPTGWATDAIFRMNTALARNVENVMQLFYESPVYAKLKEQLRRPSTSKRDRKKDEGATENATTTTASTGKKRKTAEGKTAPAAATE